MKTDTLISEQTWLAVELERIYSALAGSPPGAAAVSEVPTPLDRLQATFGLSPFERDFLLLCAGTELEERFAQACAQGNQDHEMPWPTFGLALSRLAGPHWSAIAGERPLRYWHLIETPSAQSLLRSRCRIDERVLHFLASLPATDERLSPLVQPLEPPTGALSAAQKECSENLARFCAKGPAKPVLLAGPRGFARPLVVAEAWRSLGLRGQVMRAADIPSLAVERELIARLFNRELVLSNWAMYCEGDDLEPEAARNLAAFVSQIQAPVVIAMQEGSFLEGLDGLRLAVPSLRQAERRALWMETLGEVASAMNGQLEQIVEGFHFDAPTIRLAGAAIRGLADGNADVGEAAWKVCRDQGRRSMSSLAQRLEPRARWDDLVLPPAQTDLLRMIVTQVRHKPVVHSQWGFAEKYGRGLGVSALFSGGSGTGKTLAAEIIAAELQRDLYQIDLASVVSKYIGETEKNLRRIFDAADESACVLLFNEADALFGKRSEVRDSHDRYANLEISYLLQRMESHDGVAILTTNMKHALDNAFLRRLRFIVQFPFPEAVQRRVIWQKVFPAGAPRSNLDFARLARMNVSGGTIRNIAMHAAFLAAERQSAIGMEHIGRAARMECAKIDKPLTGTETEGWL
jgi:hypothetical protein